ncbi:uncharacterized protein LOC115888348 [Sitophilus oryzae]|uniref:Uncharacterized protein LOC115888348 n=1 Tax=Sitophilus oryzae TaxID=7048 RepID=A0A6J2YIQ0_SITOR|nr:uncharacterized protein LOC115888348 [Sitophilus oryzae]
MVQNMALSVRLLVPISVAIFILSLMQGGLTIVCPRDYCKNVTCEVNVTCCTEGYHLMPTFCGCCHHCAKDIPENGSCRDLGGLTIPWNTQCAKGLVCCNATICLKPENCKK